MFNPAIASDNIKDEFIDYILSTFSIADEEYNNLFVKKLHENGVVSKGPFIDIKDNFKSGNTIEGLIDQNVLSPLFRKLESKKPHTSGYKVNLPLSRPLYKHQEKAIDVITTKKMNAVVTTGTGSGKTECFLIPVINELLQEKENGTLNAGVRTILIYPMNALANDQMKRLRNILMYFPDITFGVYNGDTKWNEKDAIVQYNNLHFNESYEELRNHLPNELISREEMIETPPHILCTNYAMLEHMLLRPENDKIFKDSNFKFVVLDESHVYSGATGMETALLLRRLKARIHSNSKTQFILTSATLGKEGESEDDIVKFAENLCGEKFTKDGIVYAVRDIVDYSESNKNIPIEVFKGLTKDENKNYQDVFDKYGLNYDDSVDGKENLYNLCFSSELYKKLRLLTNKSGPSDIHKLSKQLDIDIDGLVSFIHICSLAEKNRKNLIDAKYHFFIRALEGIYTPLIGSKQLFLNRKDKINTNGHEVSAFERIVCNNCGDLGVVGKIEDNSKLKYLTLASSYDYDKDEKTKYFRIVKDDGLQFEEFDDEVLDDVDEYEEKVHKSKKKLDTKIIKYKLCPVCGAISEYDDGNPRCKCGEKIIVLEEYKNKEKRCTKCQSGSYRRFYIGSEAATGVLATTLFEELPAKIIKEKDDEGITHSYKAGKQFLAFSDSRSDAAFFASYLDKMYKEFIRRRGIYQLINKMSDFEEEPVSVDDFVDKLANFFRKNESFKNNLFEKLSTKELRNISKKNAWIAVLNELVSASRRSSLTSLGLMQFKYKGNEEKIVKIMSDKYGISEKSCKALLDYLAISIAHFGALDLDDDIITPDDRKYIFYTENAKAVILEKSSTTSRYYMGWKARNREGKTDSYYLNNRVRIVRRVLNSDIHTANQFLEDYFNEYLLHSKNEYRLVSGKGDYYFMPVDNYEIYSNVSPNAEWYKCDKCGKISTIDIDGCCLENGCSGHLKKVAYLNKEMTNNHYLNLYNKEDMTNLIVKEHTAQLSREEALGYQIDFEKNRIHALSCSTTFEMGVDVGDLETVFLRDVPPTAANYAQRAGRAGRSDNSAAYALTYAKLSSHDFTYFKEPNKIIVGNIKPPMFKVDNEKIVLRHINSVVLGYFFGKMNYYFNENNAIHFLEEGGFDSLVEIINEYPDDLKNLLINSIPNIEKFNWKENLIGEEGILFAAVNEYQNDVKEMNDAIDNNLQIQTNPKTSSDDKDKAAVMANRFRKSLNKYRSVKMIDFLVRNNILPKYGFPIDSVDLDVNVDKEKKKELQLSRDLKMAISEYAPGEKVIANQKMYTSRYIKKSFFNNKMDYYKSAVCQCEECKTWNYSKVFKSVDDVKCVACGAELPKSKWDEGIEPRAGFIAENKAEDVPMTRPEKIYRSNDSYIGDGQKMNIYNFNINGNMITLKSSENDSIMTVSNTNFYVCPMCGYTYGIHDRILIKDNKEDKKATNDRLAGYKSIEVKKTHEDTRGRVCRNHTFYKKKLNHIYKTDVVLIDFGSMASDFNTMISVMYALLNGMSEVLDIDSNDISGCLKISNFNGSVSTYNIVLYDSVPGGAGHVSRLIARDNLLKEVIHAAYNRVEMCNCDTSCYSCLRSYNNQRFHDNLDRKLAKDFLELLNGDVKRIDESTRNDKSDERIILDEPVYDYTLKITDECKRLSKDDFDEFAEYLLEHGANEEIVDLIKNKIHENEISMPSFKDSEFEVNGTQMYCSYMWKKQKLMLFDDEDEMLEFSYENAKDSDFVCFFLNKDFDFNRIINYLSNRGI